MCSDQAAVALLETKQVSSLAGCLEVEDLLSDVFKSGQNLNETNAVILSDRICQIRGNDGLDQLAILRQSLCCLSLGDLIICQQTAGHVTGQGDILAALGILNIYAETICIRICCKNKVCILLLGKLESQFKCLCCLWVRIADCREISIRKLLLGYYIYIFKADLLEDSSRRDITCSVKRRVNDLKILANFLDAVPMNNLLL